MGKVVKLLREINEIPEPAGMPLADSVPVEELLSKIWGGNLGSFESKKIDVTLSLSQTPSVRGNQALLEKGLTLLMEDELANVPGSGNILVKTSTGTNALERPGVKIEIIDNGPGSPQPTSIVFFRPLLREENRSPQYGLNLLTCFFIVYHHGGTMCVNRSVEGGAHFEIFLPQHPTSSHSEQEQGYLERVFEMERVWEKMLVGF